MQGHSPHRKLSGQNPYPESKGIETEAPERARCSASQVRIHTPNRRGLRQPTGSPHIIDLSSESMSRIEGD